MRRSHRFGLAVGAAALFRAALAGAEYAINLPHPETIVARRIYDLHILVLWVCLALFVVVFGAMSYAILRHRKEPGREPAGFTGNAPLERIWTVVPVLILIGLAFPATKTILAMRDTRNPDLTIKITGYQWKWEYEYLGEGVRYMSVLATPQDQIDGRAAKDPHYLREVDRPLVVPVGKKIRLLTTANDVIHSWWVPEFGVKQDAVPGFIRDAWIKVDRPGIYRGQCAELCGRGHGFMPIVVEAVTPEQFGAWLAARKHELAEQAEEAEKRYSLEEMKEKGEKVFLANCAVCHQKSGEGIPGVFPALNGSKTVLGPREGHIATVFNGRPGTAMQAFGRQLSDVDLAAVITYERNAWNNRTGEVVQPWEVAALRKK
jgi:cytochrome c oxidase subunit 2